MLPPILRPPALAALAACAALCLTSGARADDAAAHGHDFPFFVANGALTLEPTHSPTPPWLDARVRRAESAAPAVSAVDSQDDGYEGRISDSFAGGSFPDATPAWSAVEPCTFPDRPEKPAARTTNVPADAVRTDTPVGGVILPSANVQAQLPATLAPGVAATMPFAGAGAAYPLPGPSPGAGGAALSFDAGLPMPSGISERSLPALTAPARLEPVPAAAIGAGIFLAPVVRRMDAPAGDLAGASGFQPQISLPGGAAYAWGENGNGQLGNGTTADSATPVAVSNLTGGVTAIAAGGTHGLAIQNGVAYAWGQNFNGQLGNGTTTDSATPLKVSVLGSNVTAVAAGEYHSLAIQNGAAFAWGRGYEGQLGNGMMNSGSTRPVAVGNLTSGVTAIAAGGYFSLAVQNGAAFAWGHNAEGELGNGTLTDSSRPGAVSGLGSGVTAIAAGYDFALAIRNSAVIGWGDGTSGQLGNGTTNGGGATTTPVQVTGLTSGVTAIAAGNGHGLAVENGNVYAWGVNDHGQLGNGTTTNSLTPLEIDPSDLRNISAVAASTYSSYALASDGSLWVWGDNSEGELGLGTATQEYLTPQHLLPPNGFAYSLIDADATGNFADAILTQVPEPETWLGGALLGGTALVSGVGRVLCRRLLLAIVSLKKTFRISS